MAAWDPTLLNCLPQSAGADFWAVGRRSKGCASMARPAARRLAMMEKGLLATALVVMRAATAADIFEVEVKSAVCIYKVGSIYKFKV